MGKKTLVSKGLAGIVILLAATTLASFVALFVDYSQYRETHNATVAPEDIPTSTTPTTPWGQWSEIRLPDTLAPEKYSITLWPRLTPEPNGQYIFKGSSSVSFRCIKKTNIIVIHSYNLNLVTFDGFHAKLSGRDVPSQPKIKSTFFTKDTQYLTVELKENLIPDKLYDLYTEFSGELSDGGNGLYRTEYMEKGKKKIMATTQMQPTSARKTFPCFDEPSMKAKYNITLIHESNITALSNTQNITAPEQSSLNLCFYVLQVRVWARTSAINDGYGNYSLLIAQKMTVFFESLFEEDYVYRKADHIAIPDFYGGAMENWGLITYRETALLFDANISSLADQEYVTSVVAHELAHQWFGNLVTMNWWNELWLSEGFATYFSYFGVNAVESSWNFKDFMVHKEVYRAFSQDALSFSHPLSSPDKEVNTPGEIDLLFDHISYSKVLLMCLQTLFKTATSKDLMDILNKTLNKNQDVTLPAEIGVILDRWILQMGFPVVTINTTNGEISQKHFLLYPDSVVHRKSKFNYTWIVPITWIKSENAQSMMWLWNSTDWVLANINVTGYYRVNYDMSNWQKLLGQLQSNHSVIPVINRAQIIDDSFHLARAGKVPITLALNSTKYLVNETEYLPWKSALDNFEYLSLMFDRTEIYGPMQVKQVDPLYNFYQSLTFNWTQRPEEFTDQYNEVNVLSIACNSENEECQTLATSLYSQWMSNSSLNPIHPNLRTTFYCTAIAAGGVKEWDFAWKMFKETNLKAEADKLRYAMSCSKYVWILSRYLQHSLNRSMIQESDFVSTVAAIASNVVGQSLAWDFMQTYWREISKKSHSGLLESVTRRFSSLMELKQLEEFIQDNKGSLESTQTLQQIVQRTKENIKWVNSNREAVSNWLLAQTRPDAN
uniref:Aminopeptidase n=1 Tax=Erpetoichthys calabaricus TaxID=27687 RepID=A0A8C4T7E7_ERPCA